MKVLAFGEILWDIIEGEHHLGGAPFNFAAHVVKCGGTASILSAVGNDRLGNRAIEEAKSHKVDTSYVAVLPQPTGTVDVFLNQGQPDYTIHENVAFDAIPPPEIRRLMREEFDVFYFGTLAQRNETSRNTLIHILNSLTFKEVFYDINLRKNYYSKEWVEYSLLKCSVFKINDSEAVTISNLLFGSSLSLKDFAARIALQFTIPTIIVTAAEKGCYVFADNEWIHLPAPVITVVDAVGAGDSFSAAFMTNYFDGRTIRSAAEIANQVGAFVASSRGAIPLYSQEIKNLMQLQ